jgi:hypothetical protein
VAYQNNSLLLIGKKQERQKSNENFNAADVLIKVSL